MSKIINVEHSTFLKDNISIYTGNRIGQYSKYLERNPIFVTYYHTNSVLSTQDTGTGGIESELGAKSPIRFNKILNFPLFNLPELKPNLVYDDTGYDIDLECSDVVILPGTIKPRGGDYFIVSIPNSKEYLFRVNNFNYNTIQSNDYYTIECDVKYIGEAAERDRMAGQVVEEYLTIFDNIGTQNKCFIKSTDVDYINEIAALSSTLKLYYQSAFYLSDLNSFSYMTGAWSTNGTPIYRYDPFLEAFINKSKIYYTPGDEKTLTLSQADVVQFNFDFEFNHTLYNALLKQDISLLMPYCYYMTLPISKRYSIYTMLGYSGESVTLACYNKPPGPVPPIEPCTDTPPEHEIYPLPKTIPTWTFCTDSEYFESDFIKSIICGDLTTTDYFKLVIFDYLYNRQPKIDKRKILDKLEVSQYNFYYLPIIIFILEQLYDIYFKSESDKGADYSWL